MIIEIIIFKKFFMHFFHRLWDVNPKTYKLKFTFLEKNLMKLFEVKVSLWNYMNLLYSNILFFILCYTIDWHFISKLGFKYSIRKKKLPVIKIVTNWAESIVQNLTNTSLQMKSKVIYDTLFWTNLKFLKFKFILLFYIICLTIL